MAQHFAAGSQLNLLHPCGIYCLRGANRSADWNQLLSRAVSPVYFVAQLLPGRILKFFGQTATANSDEWGKLSGFGLLLLLQHEPQSLLSECTEGGFFLSGEALHPLEKVIRDFNGGLHNMATHTCMAGHPYQEPFLNRVKHYADVSFLTFHWRS